MVLFGYCWDLSGFGLWFVWLSSPRFVGVIGGIFCWVVAESDMMDGYPVKGILFGL